MLEDMATTTNDSMEIGQQASTTRDLRSFAMENTESRYAPNLSVVGMGLAEPAQQPRQQP